MTWEIFLNTIKNAGIAKTKIDQILQILFQRSGYCSEKPEGIARETIKSWIKGSRNCKVYSYFPDGKLQTPEELYKFFRDRPADKLKKLQEICRKEKDGSSPIDCETEDLDRFCWSLVNQFLDLLGLERLDLPASDTITDNDYYKKQKWVSFAETPTEQMRELFEKAVEYFKIAVYMCRLPDYLSGEEFYGSSIYAFNDVIETEILSVFLQKKTKEFTK